MKYSNLLADNQGTYLSDAYPDEKPWDTHKGENERMQGLLVGVESDYIQRLRERMGQCGEWLVFAHTTPDERGRVFRLREASFCRVRTCPYCQWRRSLLYTARMLEALPRIVEQSPTLRMIHLTLTVKNTDITDLRSEIGALARGWQRLVQLKRLRKSVRGYVRSVEVTRGADGSAHPHIHALLMVPSWYFTDSNYYVPHADWCAMWRGAMRLDYDPQVSVQACRQAQGYEKMVRELTKYSTKPQDLLEDAGWLVEYITQVRGLRFFSTGGIVKEALGEIETDGESLIATGEEPVADTDVLALSWFDWEKPTQRYRHKETKIRNVEGG